jgi:hypothetical protein
MAVSSRTQQQDLPQDNARERFALRTALHTIPSPTTSSQRFCAPGLLAQALALTESELADFEGAAQVVTTVLSAQLGPPGHQAPARLPVLRDRHADGAHDVDGAGGLLRATAGPF